MTMDLNEVRNYVLSLEPEEFVEEMKDMHFDYPLRTKELTDSIVHALTKSVQSMKSEEFLKMIEERKAEYNQEIREKREEGRKRIQDMKSRTGLDPLEIFPKEIWMKILDEAMLEDKRSMREVHDLYRSLTEDTLISDILLPLTLTPLVRNACGIQQGDSKWYRTSGPGANLTEFLSNLRLVSKSLRNSVDRWFEDDILMSLRSNSRGLRGFPWSMVCIDLKGKEPYKEFKKMANGLRNEDESSIKPERFFVRAIHFYLNEDDGIDGSGLKKKQFLEFQENINTVLDHIGPQIWYFSFQHDVPLDLHHRLHRNTPMYDKRYALLQGWLKRMPNLKWLKITIDRWGEESEPDWQLMDYFKLPKDKKATALPPLPHLERLDLQLEKPVRYALGVFNHFLTAYPHIKILNMFRIQNVMNNSLVMHTTLTDSTTLERVCSIDGPRFPPERAPIWAMLGGGDSDEEEDEDKEEKEEEEAAKTDADTMTRGEARIKISDFMVFNMKWPLKQLKMEMNLLEESVYYLFQSLEKFQTLENLSLLVKNATIKDDICYLKLPNLKSFQLEFEKFKIEWFEKDVSWAFFFSLQYLLQMKKLKTLEWKCSMAEDVWEKAKKDVEYLKSQGRGEMLDFGDLVMSGESLKKSNIWLVFPWLNEVKTERATRTGLESEDERPKSSKKEYRRSEIDLD